MLGSWKQVLLLLLFDGCQQAPSRCVTTYTVGALSPITSYHMQVKAMQNIQFGQKKNAV